MSNTHSRICTAIFNLIKNGILNYNIENENENEETLNCGINNGVKVEFITTKDIRCLPLHIVLNLIKTAIEDNIEGSIWYLENIKYIHFLDNTLDEYELIPIHPCEYSNYFQQQYHTAPQTLIDTLSSMSPEYSNKHTNVIFWYIKHISTNTIIDIFSHLELMNEYYQCLQTAQLT